MDAARTATTVATAELVIDETISFVVYVLYSVLLLLSGDPLIDFDKNPL